MADTQSAPTGETPDSSAPNSSGPAPPTRPPSPGRRPPQLADWLASAGLVALFVLGSFVERGTQAEVRLAGVVLLLSSLPFLFAPFATLKRHGRVPDGASYCDTTTVVDQGVYGVVRHPQYLGYGLLAAGFGCRLQNPLTTALALAVLVLLYMQALREEGDLAERLEGYGDYARRVPRFNAPAGLFRYIVTKRRSPDDGGEA